MPTITGPMTIDTPGSYTLAHSIGGSQETIIHVTVGGVAINLNGRTIQGRANTKFGIRVSGPGPISIINGRIVACDCGLFSAAPNVSIYNIDATHNRNISFYSSGTGFRSSLCTPSLSSAYVAVGDSITLGQHVDAGKQYCQAVGVGLGFANVINQGKSGDSLIGMNQRIDAIIAAGAGLITVMGGTNDIAGGVSAGRTVAQIINRSMTSLDDLIAKLQASTIPFHIITPPACRDWQENLRVGSAFVDAIKARCASAGIMPIDYWQRRVDAAISRTGFNSWFMTIPTSIDVEGKDKYHPGVSGHADIAAALIDAI